MTCRLGMCRFNLSAMWFRLTKASTKAGSVCDRAFECITSTVWQPLVIAHFCGRPSRPVHHPSLLHVGCHSPRIAPGVMLVARVLVQTQHKLLDPTDVPTIEAVQNV